MQEKPDVLTKERWRTDKSNWKAGLFYFNPYDKRVFPPKRFGGGWTINFANAKSVLVFISFFVAAIVVTWLFNR